MELGKLLINPLAKIDLFFFFLIILWNKKERLDVVLIRLSCGSKKASCRQIQSDLFYHLFYLYM